MLAAKFCGQLGDSVLVEFSSERTDLHQKETEMAEAAPQDHPGWTPKVVPLAFSEVVPKIGRAHV